MLVTRRERSSSLVPVPTHQHLLVLVESTCAYLYPSLVNARHTNNQQNPSPGPGPHLSFDSVCRLFSAWTLALHHPVAARSRFVSDPVHPVHPVHPAHPAPPAWCLGPSASHQLPGLARLIILAHCQTRTPSGFIRSTPTSLDPRPSIKCCPLPTTGHWPPPSALPLLVLATRRRQNLPLPPQSPYPTLWPCTIFSGLCALPWCSSRDPSASTPLFHLPSTKPSTTPSLGSSCCRIALRRHLFRRPCMVVASRHLVLSGRTDFSCRLPPLSSLSTSTPYWWRRLSGWLLQVPGSFGALFQPLLQPLSSPILGSCFRSLRHCAGCLNVSESKYHLEPSCRSLELSLL